MTMMTNSSSPVLQVHPLLEKNPLINEQKHVCLQVAESMRVLSFGALSCTMVCYNVRIIFFVNTLPQERMKNS